MLTITPSQHTAFEAQELRRFREDLINALRANLPDEYRRKSDDEVGRFVDWGIEKARGYQIVMEPDVARFIELVSGFGKDFDRNFRTAWMDEILRRVETPAQQRLDLVLERLAFGGD